MRGRKPLPTAVKELNGNPGRRPLNDSEPIPTGALLEPPEPLNERQLRIWRNVLAMAPKGVLRDLDGRLLVRYCRTYDLWIQATDEVERSGFTAEGARGPSVAPALNVMQKLESALVRQEAELGFTPASRSRLHAEEPQDPRNEFADL